MKLATDAEAEEVAIPGTVSKHLNNYFNFHICLSVIPCLCLINSNSIIFTKSYLKVLSAFWNKNEFWVLTLFYEGVHDPLRIDYISLIPFFFIAFQVCTFECSGDGAALGVSDSTTGLEVRFRFLTSSV